MSSVSLVSAGCQKSSVQGFLTQSDIGSFIGRVLDWIVALVQNFELIGLFAVASLTIWATLEVLALSLPLQRRRNLQFVSDYFLLSLAFFFVAAVAEYETTQPWHIFDQSLSMVLEAFIFVFGLFTLIVGVWGLRQTGRSGRKALSLPEYGLTIMVALLAAMNGIFLVSIGYRYSMLPTVTKVFFWLLCVSILASFLRLIVWHGHRKSANLAVLVIAAAWIYIAVAFLLVSMGLPLLRY